MPPPALTVHNVKYCRKRGERPAGILDNLSYEKEAVVFNQGDRSTGRSEIANLKAFIRLYFYIYVANIES